jgi:hypothetical protein
MQCRDIESILENEGLSPLPEAVRAHAASCSSCRGLVEDFSAIVAVAEQLPAEVEPPTRIWVALRNQLEAEGIIKTHAETPSSVRESWWERIANVLHGRTIATALGLAIVAAFIVQLERGRINPPPQSAKIADAREIANSPQAIQPPTINESLGKTGQELGQVEQNEIRIVQQAGMSNQDRVDVSLRQNLKSLNQFIEECQHRLKEDPNDELAREYLSVAYQQKAELLSAMLDRGRSVN